MTELWRKVVRIVFLAAAAIAAVADVPAQQAQLISVGPNVQISAARGKESHFETVAAADPRDPNHLIAAAMIGRGADAASAVYFSNDGGHTWARALKTPDVGRGWDPEVAFAADGLAYFVAGHAEMVERRPGELPFRNAEALVYRSADGGKTWSEPARASRFEDRPFLTIDQGSSRFAGRLYLVYAKSLEGINSRINEPHMLEVVTSTDGGLTFGSPVAVSTGPVWRILYHPRPVVLSDGSFLELFQINSGDTEPSQFVARVSRDPERSPAKPDSEFYAFRSTDGGRTLTKPTKIADTYFVSQNNLSTVPGLAVDLSRSAFRDRVYLAWADARSGRSEILLSYSADGGKTWSRPRAVNDDRARDNLDGPDHCTPTIAVNHDGLVGVMWYDRRDDPNNVGYHVRFTASLDGGDSWLPSVRVSTAGNSFEGSETPSLFGIVFPVDAGGIRWVIGDNAWHTNGHTAGLAAAADGSFHPVWVDNRTGLPQMWTAAIAVKGSATPNGSPELSAYVDVSRQITAQISELALDRKTGRLTANLRLRNTSASPVQGPFRVRVLDVRSPVGIATIQNADNRETLAGAVWNFDGLPAPGALEPGQTSEPKPITFRLTDIRSFRRNGRLDAIYLNLETRVLAPLKQKVDPRPR